MTPNYDELKKCPKCDGLGTYKEEYCTKNPFYSGDDLTIELKEIKE